MMITSFSHMVAFYRRAYEMLPEFVKRRINPLEYSIQDFIRSANSTSGKSVILDAGAGEARWAHYFDGHLYLALDSGVGDRGWDYSRISVCADLTSIPLASTCVDVVLNIQVLEHVSRPLEVLREIYRVLKTDGKLYLTAPQGWHEHQQPHDFFRFTRYSLEPLLKGAGFREIKIEPLGGYFHYLGQRLTYIPKVLFEGRPGLQRALFSPLELVSLALFCFFSPMICYYLDGLDRKKEFTLGYRCLAVK